MPRPGISAADLCAMSIRCAQAFVDYDGDAPTAALVTAAGCSERTFFRHFPTKADSLRPLFTAGIERFAEIFGAQEAGPLIDLVPDALIPALVDPALGANPAILAVTLRNPALRRVWLEANEELTALLAPAIAERLHCAPHDIDCRVAAAQVTALAVTTVRLMVDDHLAPAEAARRVSAVWRALSASDVRPTDPSPTDPSPTAQSPLGGADLGA